ncbi:MAG: OadG family protein [Acutalibacteraceae bacterium]|nr:OadG family protein [Acutalibacteraceae bacterium]MEE1047865.1 OadG family protein [Clostridia bacterium]
MEISNTFVVVLGIGVVFVGLICIVLLCKIVSAFCMLGEKKTNNTPAPVPTAVAAEAQPIQNRQEIIAAVSACVAEELGTDISAIRILSFKKI